MIALCLLEVKVLPTVGKIRLITTRKVTLITLLERWLIKSELFHVLGKKKLMQSDVEWDVVIVDVSEHPIERPKKNKSNSTQEKEKALLKLIY